MSSIPSNLARVPTLLGSQLARGSITRTNRDLLNLEVQMTTGKALNRPSDDSVAASLVTALDAVLERREQRVRNLNHAEATLNNLDSALADASSIVLEARTVALSQIGVGSDADTRAAEAVVIEAMVDEMVRIANRQYRDQYLFAGAATAREPVSSLLGGLRYGGEGDGAVTDLGLPRTITITTSGEDAFGALSSRVEGEVDLDPSAVGDTRLADLDGAMGLGVRPGSIDVDVNGTVYALDLGGAGTLGDVITAVEDLLNANEPGALGAGGVTIDAASGNRLHIDLNPGFAVMFTDTAGEGAAADLGLTDVIPFEDGTKELGTDFQPRLTELTAIADLNALAGPLGTLRLTNAGQSRDLDLSGARTVQDVINAVEALGLGVRVEIDASAGRLSFVNELSGAEMAVAEVAGGTTASALGVRSLDASTLLADFNGGRGVHVISGSVDPISGAPDPAADLDFQITLKDGRAFPVDLAGAVTVQDVLDAVNGAATGAGIVVPGSFEAALAADGNGIALTDNTAGTTTSVTALNGSFAAEDLGILGSTASATLTGEDRAMVAVDSVFTHLMSLREALAADDERGITLAAEALERDIDRLARTRAEVGLRGRRVADAVRREEDLSLQDQTLRSQVQDLDFTDAAVRFAALQRQLQAGLITAGQLNSLSLLDFLG